MNLLIPLGNLLLQHRHFVTPLDVPFLAHGVVELASPIFLLQLHFELGGGLEEFLPVGIRILVERIEGLSFDLEVFEVGFLFFE